MHVHIPRNVRSFIKMLCILLLADANCLANKLAGAKLRKFLDIKSKYLYSAT